MSAQNIDTLQNAPFADSLTTVHIAYSHPEASVIQATLRAHGIPCMALGEGHASIDWYAMSALQGIHIRVPSWAAADAFSLFPEFQYPPSKKEIMAEIKSGKGLYGRKRLILIHGTLLLLWLMPVLYNIVAYLKFAR